MEHWRRWRTLEQNRVFALTSSSAQQRLRVVETATIDYTGAMVRLGMILDDDSASSGGETMLYGMEHEGGGEARPASEFRGKASGKDAEPGGSLGNEEEDGENRIGVGRTEPGVDVTERRRALSLPNEAQKADQRHPNHGEEHRLQQFAPLKTPRRKGKGQLRMSRLRLRALDFLSAIPMEAEREEQAAAAARAAEELAASQQQQKENESNEPQDGGQDQPAEFLQPDSSEPAAGSASGLRGIRLRGKTDFRYMSRRVEPKNERTEAGLGSAAYPSTSSAVVQGKVAIEVKSKAWYERELIACGAHNSSRLFLSCDKGYPGMVFSVIKFDPGQDSKTSKRSRLARITLEMPRRRTVRTEDKSRRRNRGTSYARYFNLEWAVQGGDRIDAEQMDEEESWDRCYRPEELDDPRIRQGKHRTVQALEGFMISVLPYTKNKDIKEVVNEVFREQHPDLPAEMTLSKIRNLKREVLLHVRHLDLEFSTGALAILYFEKLVVKGVVSKANRKLVASVCLVLAFKFNEPRRGVISIKDLLADIERVQQLAPKQVLDSEFSVYGHLSFHLHVEKEFCIYHFQRLLKSTGISPTEYLGDELAKHYFPPDRIESPASDDERSPDSASDEAMSGLVSPLGRAKVMNAALSSAPKADKLSRKEKSVKQKRLKKKKATESRARSSNREERENT